MFLRTLAAAALLAGTVLAQWPSLPIPTENPVTPQKVVLGKALFWDEQLSADDSIACGTCHLPEHGGTDPALATWRHPGPDGVYGTDDDIHGAPGVTRQATNGDFTPAPTFGLHRQVTGRVPGSTLGALFHDNLFWDMRASTTFVDPETQQVLISYWGALESQAVGPPMSAVEMACEGWTWARLEAKLAAARPLALASQLTPDLVAALQQHPTYPALFANAFGDPAITAARIAFAIASYERTLIPDDTPWDRFMNGQTSALTVQEQHGWQLFQTSGRCRNCHTEPLFQDDVPHVVGLRQKREDHGVGGISGVVSEDGAFKTPTLRNAGLRARLFHNGQSPALGDPTQVTDPASVLNVYLQGGGVDRTSLDGYLVPLNQYGVTVADMQDILEFVRRGLTDPRAAAGLPPFDHPLLHSQTAVPPLVYGAGLAGAYEPFLMTSVPGYLGNQEWKLGIAAGDGATLAYLGYGLTPQAPGVFYAGIPFHVDVLDGRFVVLQGPTGAPGYATWRLPIPNDPNLGSYEFHFQVWAFDAMAPLGISTSPGARLLVR